MDQDNFTDAPPSEDQSHRRSFGGLGRGPAALLLAAGLLIGGGIGGFVAANAGTTVSTLGVDTPGDLASVPTHGRIDSDLTERSAGDRPRVTASPSLPPKTARPQGEPSLYPARLRSPGASTPAARGRVHRRCVLAGDGDLRDPPARSLLRPIDGGVGERHRPHPHLSVGRATGSAGASPTGIRRSASSA